MPLLHKRRRRQMLLTWRPKNKSKLRGNSINQLEQLPFLNSSPRRPWHRYSTIALQRKMKRLPRMTNTRLINFLWIQIFSRPIRFGTYK